jgi:hypothetical protein
MADDFDDDVVQRKNSRRQKFNEHKNRKFDVPEEQRYISKSKKQLKKIKEEIRVEEIWEDWEQYEDFK